jgi:urea ABC transporter ATP-binding protein UrtE
MLELRDVVAARGRTPVIHGASLKVDAGESVSLLGRNGMGKTTLLRSIIGLTPVNGGSIVFDGREITRWPAHTIARHGIGYVPQGRGIFGEHTIEENLFIGVRQPRQARAAADRIYELFPRLRERLRQRAGTLSGGEQQMLAVARCLLLDPKLVLLDEPTEGLQPSIVQNLLEALNTVRADTGVALLLVEQNLDFAFALTQRGYVLEKGAIASQGPTEVLRNDQLIKDYLAV